MESVAGQPRPAWLIPAVSLWRREVVRFLRQRSRVAGALGTPLVFWLLLGAGMGKSFKGSGPQGSSSYLVYSFPGMMVLIVMFTAIFSTISIIEDRREGFMQSALAAPIRRSAVVLGKVLGSATLAVVQALVFMLLAPLAGVPLSLASFLASTAVLILVSLELSALGVLMAWPMESTQGFHALMNLFLMPMWIMRANPLTYGVAALRQALSTGAASVSSAEPLLGLSLAVSVAFTVVVFVGSAYMVAKDT